MVEASLLLRIKGQEKVLCQQLWTSPELRNEQLFEVLYVTENA